MDVEWDERKNRINLEKHGVSFEDAARAFSDPRHLVIADESHSTREESRFFCIGQVDGLILTVRFTIRAGAVRIFGAGAWREGKSRYEAQRDEE